MKTIKSVLTGILAGANVATVLVMLLLGFSGYVNPESHPMLSSLSFLFPFGLLANLVFLFIWLTFKWRKAWIPLLGFLAAYVPVRSFIPFNLPSTPPEEALKVISYNVEGYFGEPNYKDGFRMIYDYLKEQKADIVCLQEDNDTWRKSEVFFDSLYAYNDIVQISSPKNPILNRLGIHTRFPIIRKERIAYESFSNGSVAWYLKIDDDTLIVINNHLESTHLTVNDREQYTQMIHGGMNGDTAKAESRRLLSKLAESSALRAPAAKAVSQYIDEHRQYPILVCDDFNDHPLSYACHTVGKDLTDCYVATGNGMGTSYYRHGMHVRIDHMFCSKDMTPYQCKIDSKFDASDHYPVICWLKMRVKP